MISINTVHLFSIAALVTLLASCAPLQQAPLLYSSKTSVGIDLTTSTTETPGASISVGVKIVDAAYVPVAVSKDTQTSKNGETKPFDIERIEAVYGEGSTGSQLDYLTEENKKKITAYLEEKKNESIAKSNFENQKSKIDNTKKEIELIKISINKIVDPLAMQGASEDDEKNKEINNRALDSKTQQLGLEEADFNKLKGELESQTKRANDAFVEASKAASLLRTDKRDAMSVYGRFDGTTDNETKTLSSKLTVGKIFSTGVAAQNLTEAVKLDGLSTSIASCMEALKELTTSKSSDDIKKDISGKINEICGMQKNKK